MAKGAARYVLDASTVYHREESRRENLFENWTIVLETKRLACTDDIYILWRVDRRSGHLRELKELSAGLSPGFLEHFRALSSKESGQTVPPRLQELLLKPSVPAFLGNCWLKLSPGGWGFATFPVLTPGWMEKLLRFSGELSSAMD